jgi:hypothetical protein
MIDINVNSGEGTVARKLYTGLAVCLVKAINPTLAEAKELGINLKEEPNYIMEKDGVKLARVAVYLSNPDLGIDNVVMSMFVEQRADKTKDGNKSKFINQYGKTTIFIENLSQAPDYYSQDGAREAFIGEDILVSNFIWAWADAKYNDDKKDKILINTEKLFKGDFSELKGLVKPLVNNGVRVLLGVKTAANGKQYQDVYTRRIEKFWMNSTTEFDKALNDQYKQFKSDYQNSLIFQEYGGSLIKPDVQVVVSATSDDLPF